MTVTDLGELLANWRSDAQALRRQGMLREADALDQRADEAQGAAVPWLTWLTESEAAMKSGRPVRWLRLHFAGWLDQGLARWEGRERRFRDCVIPQRRHRSAVREDARRAAHGDAA